MGDNKKPTREVIEEWAVGDVDKAVAGLVAGSWDGVIGTGRAGELEWLVSLEADWFGGEQW